MMENPEDSDVNNISTPWNNQLMLVTQPLPQTAGLDRHTADLKENVVSEHRNGTTVHLHILVTFCLRCRCLTYMKDAMSFGVGGA